MDDLFVKLKAEKFLENSKNLNFAERLAFYVSELNMIHPFREGNGRAIREFIRCLALKRGYIIDWSFVDGQELLQASIISVNKNLSLLTKCLYNAIGNKY